MKILSKWSMYPQQASELGRREAETSVLIFGGSTGLVPHTFTEPVCPASLTFQSLVCRNYPNIEHTELQSNYKFLKIRNKAFKLFTPGNPMHQHFTLGASRDISGAAMHVSHRNSPVSLCAWQTTGRSACPSGLFASTGHSDSVQEKYWRVFLL